MAARAGTARSIQRQLVSLVRLPSRAGVDDCRPMLAAVRHWLAQHRIKSRVLKDDGRVVGICGEISGAHKGPTYLLNATVDTAEFGDVERWTRPPLSGAVVNGWLYGRGSADSKAGVAVFCHVLAALADLQPTLHGTMAFLFDAEEHSGQFAGVRRYMASRGRARRHDLKGVMIGYPGNTGIVIGCRGFYRAIITVRGQSAHSGSARHRGVNAVRRAADLIERFDRLRLPSAGPGKIDFALPPQVTVTAAHGGTDFSTVPDACVLNVDIRLTPRFTRARAVAEVRDVVAAFDRRSGAGAAPRTDIESLPGWPAYRLDDDSPMYTALRHAAAQFFERDVPGVVAGPSSIGNFLSTLGVPATSGFGVTYRNLHATDECVELASIEPVYQTYLTAARQLLGGPPVT